MAKSLTARLGLQRWSADTDTQERAEFDAGHGKLDDLAAMDMQGTLANRPAAVAGNRGLYYYVTGDATAANNDRLYRSTGAGWFEVLTEPRASAAYAPIAPPTARYSKGAVQSVASGTQTIVTWDTVVRQDGAANAVPASTLTVPSAGWYLIEAGVRWATNATGWRRAGIYAAGIYVGQSEIPATSGMETIQSVSALVYMPAGSLTFTVQVAQGSGAALDIAIFQEHNHVAFTKVRS